MLVYIPKPLHPQDVQLTARVRDSSRQSTSAGTEIPVVQERDFRFQPFLLTNVPSDSRFRANLRVYGGLETFGPPSKFIHPGGSVHLDIYDSRDLRVALVSTSIELSAPERAEGSAFFTRPGYASIGSLTATFPVLRDVPEYTVRITPGQTLADPPRERSVWAFVSITNNETQHVTMVTP